MVSFKSAAGKPIVGRFLLNHNSIIKGDYLMKVHRSSFVKFLVAVISISVLAGCSSKIESASQPTVAIDKLRKSLNLPASPLKFIESTYDPNSPSGGLEVAKYQDGKGRIFSVDLKTNQVVEIDARTILSNISSNTPSLSQYEIKAKAVAFAKIVIPNFDSLQSSLQYEEGGKVDNYFFDWYGEMGSGRENRPRLQFGFYKNGTLFAYYNSLSVEK
jgi:hypothetical protein